MKHTRLTPAQARETQALNARLLAISRDYRVFVRSIRSMAWPVAHVPELWAAHIARHFPEVL